MKLEIGKTYFNTIGQKVKVIAKDVAANQYIGQVENNTLLLYSLFGVQLNWPFERAPSQDLIRECREPIKLEGFIYCQEQHKDSAFSSVFDALINLAWKPTKESSYKRKFRVTIEEIIE